MKKKEREMYDSFAQIINKYLYQSSISVNITSSSSLQLSMVELNSLPGVTVGDVILIEGTHSLTHSLTYSLTLTHSLTHSLTYSLTLTHSLTQVPLRKLMMR
jgi:hypothetical protein